MNGYFITGAILLVLIGLAHSVLGERQLLMPLFRDGRDHFFLKNPWAKNILRFAWHLITIAWCGMAAAAVDMAAGGRLTEWSIWAFTATFALTGLVILFFSRGRHIAWIVFLIISGCFGLGGL